MTSVVLVGTLDTKGAEYQWVADRLREHGVDVLVVDAGVGTGGAFTSPIAVTAFDVASAAGTSLERLRVANDRGAAVTAMGDGAAVVLGRLLAEGRLDGVLALGGSGGSSIAARAVRDLPVGLPKLLVSTMAAGDVAPYVGASDVTMMYSVVDIAGINQVSRAVLGNAAAAVAAMARAYASRSSSEGERPLVAASMFGVTTPAVDAARARLDELGYEVLVFHATGAGGKALEALARSGLLAGVLDLTTTELADDLVGGVLTAGPDRLTAAGAAGVPQVVSFGALDMVNFGPRETVPERFADRTFFVHNPTVTLMRTTEAENAELGRRLGAKLAAATGPTALVVPRLGVSALDADGMPFRDEAADALLFEAALAAIGSAVTVVDVNAHINDQAVAVRAADLLHELIGAMRMDRATALRRLRATVDAGRPVIGAGAGTGLSAKSAEMGGVDLIIIYNSGRYRMAGRGSLSGLLAYGDANQVVVEMSREVLPVVRDIPVLAGVNGTDPFRLMGRFLDELASLGFSGVQNFPTVGLFDGVFRQNLEETGMGYGLEVEMIRLAHERDLLTAPYVFDADSAVAMAEAGADILVPHLGLTTSGTIGAKTAVTLAEAAEGCSRCATPPPPSTPICWCSATAARSPNRRTPPTCSPHDRCGRLLRRLLDGAAAHRARHRRPGPGRSNPSHCPKETNDDRSGCRPDDVPTRVLDWGTIKWLVSPGPRRRSRTDDRRGHRVPGEGPRTHLHPNDQEVIYVISGEGVQTVGEDTPAFPIKAGDAVYIPANTLHSTFNTTWQPLRLVVIYTPAGAEKQVDELPDVRILDPGVAPEWRQDR